MGAVLFRASERKDDCFPACFDNPLYFLPGHILEPDAVRHGFLLHTEYHFRPTPLLLFWVAAGRPFLNHMLDIYFWLMSSTYSRFRAKESAENLKHIGQLMWIVLTPDCIKKITDKMNTLKSKPFYFIADSY